VLYALTEVPTLGDREDVGRASALGIKTLRQQSGSISVDRIGVGSGALSNILGTLRQEDFGKACRAVGCNFGAKGAKAGVPDEFLNLRAYQYWQLRLALESPDCACAPLGGLEDRLFNGFSKIEYYEDANGKIRLMEKSKIKSVLGRSPDIEDATVMAFNAPRMIRQRVVTGGQRRSSAVLEAAP
jgi:hypothetical protein